MTSPMDVIVHCTYAVLLVLIGRDRIPSYAQGYFMSMISENQFYVLNPGESVAMECSFHADHYSLFDNPVMWRKQQYNEDLPINILSNINDPFVASNRFEVTYTAAEPRYQLELSITDVVSEDSGNYTCEIRGAHSAVLAHVMHHLFVRAPIESIELTTEQPTSTRSLSRDFSHSSSSSSSASLWRPLVDPLVIHLVENHPSAVTCTVRGGQPPPNVELVVERGRDLTPGTTLTTTNNVTGGTRGFRRVETVLERSTRTWLPWAVEDGLRLLCVVTVPGLAPRVETATLDVDYTPKIACAATEASVDDVNIYVKCDVRAKPKATSIFWVLSANGTTLATGESVDGFWAVTKELADDVTEALMYIRRVTSDKLRRYTLVVENAVGISRRDVELLQNQRPPVPPAKPLSDAAVSHANERVASRDTAQARKGKQQQQQHQQDDVSGKVLTARSGAATTARCHRRRFQSALGLLSVSVVTWRRLRTDVVLVVTLTSLLLLLLLLSLLTPSSLLLPLS